MNLKRTFTAVGALFFISVLLWSCSSDNESPGQPGTAAAQPYTPTSAPLGGIQTSCGKNNAYQTSRQVTYSPKNQPNQCRPQFQFYQSRVSDLEVNLDCQRGGVGVLVKATGQRLFIPFGGAGQVQGSIEYPYQVENDGRGNARCLVKTTVHFDGRAVCQSPGTSSPSDTLEMNTEMEFGAYSGNSNGIRLDTDPENPSPSSTPFPGEAPGTGETSPTPGEIPTESSSPQPSVSQQPSPSPSPSCSPLPELVTHGENVTIPIPPNASSKGCTAFGGNLLVLDSGVQVTWVNQDSEPHTVTSDSGDWDSGILAPDETFTHSFNEPGLFSYHSTLDPQMKGQLRIQPGSTLPSPSPTATASEIPSPGPSPSETVIVPVPPVPPPFPSQTPIPGATQVISCVIENPCPVETQVDYSCPAQQTS